MNYSIEIDVNRIQEIANVILKKVKIVPDKFTDELYYPSPKEDKEIVASYFFFMVAIDHRTSRNGKIYEAVIDGRKFHGADLLYYLGKRKLDEDRDFFTAKRMTKITVEEVRNWLSISGKEPWGIELRTTLLRDAGLKLQLLYDGSVLKLLEESKGYLRSTNSVIGLLDMLRVFLAYSDPVEKKSYLLVKFLERRGLVKIRDLENLHVPVDNHLSRIAIRWGIVKLSENLLVKIQRQEAFTFDEDVMLRLFIRKAYKLLSEKVGVKPSILDDFLWNFGRKTCIRGTPFCIECPLNEVCEAYTNRKLMVNEHYFVNTWYY